MGAGRGRRRAARQARPRAGLRRSSPRSCARATDTRRVHTILRDQRTVAGIGRGLLRRHPAPGPALAVRLARRRCRSTTAARLLEATRGRPGRGRLEAERERAGGPAHEDRRPLRPSTAATARRAPDAAPTSAGCRTSPTRSRTAPRARPAARSWPTAACPGWCASSLVPFRTSVHGADEFVRIAQCRP